MDTEITGPLQPMKEFVVIRRDDPEKKYGGIIIPDSAQETAMFGTVLACGPGIINPHNGRLSPMPLKVGDRVVFGSKYNEGHEFVWNGEKVTILRLDALAGVYEP